MADSSPEPEFGDEYDWKPPTPKKEEFKTSRETRLAERSSKRTTASSQRKSSGGASQPSRAPLVELLSPSEIQQRRETFENTRKISEQRQNARKSWQFDRTCNSTSSALRKKESSSFVYARKPSPSQRSDATQLSSKQSVASSSANSKRESVAHSSKSTFACKPSPSHVAPSSSNNLNPSDTETQIERAERKQRLAERKRSLQTKPSSSLSFNSLGSHALKSTSSSALRKKESASFASNISTSTSSTSRHKKSDGQASQSLDSLRDWNRKGTSRKPSSSQRSVAAPSSNKNSIQSSSQGNPKKKKSKTKSLEVLVSNMNGGIKKEVHVRKSAYPVAKSCVDTFKDDAQKQCVSLVQTERHRNSCGDNDNLHNSMSMVCLSATQTDAGDFFSPTSDPKGRLKAIKNVLAKNPTFNTGVATTMLSLITILKTSKYNCFATQRARDLPDYGGDYNKGSYMLQSFANRGAICVTDGTQVNADNAHEKLVYILHNMMKHGNPEELKTLECRRDFVKETLRFDCMNCNNAIAVGGGGKFCLTHIPEFCTVPYDDWKTRYDEKTEYGRARMKYRDSLNEVSKKWNGKKEDWYGCGGKVSPSSGERFLCSQCTMADNARRE